METPPVLEECEEFIRFMTGPEIPLPSEITLELTSRCNLACVMCPRRSETPRTEPERVLAPALLQRLAEAVIPRLSRLNLVGDGEALLEPDLLITLLEQTRRARIPVTLCSNGTLLTPEIGSRLIELGLADLTISLDAATEETYQAIRGGSLELLLERVRAIETLKERAGSPLPRLHASLVAMRRNIEELPDLVNLAAGCGMASITVQAMGEGCRDMLGESAFQADPEEAEAAIVAALDRADGCGISLKVWPEGYRSEALEGRVPRDDGEALLKDCPFVWRSPFITATGDVRACCADLPAMGNLMESDLPEIWRGEGFRSLRRALLTRRPPEECLRCPGTGWYPGTPLPDSLRGGEDHRGFAGGFHPPEHGPPPFRWSDGRATLFLASTGAETLLVEHRAGDLPGLPRKGLIRTSGGSVEPLPSEPSHWRITELTGGAWTEPLLRVDLEIPGAARPVDLDPASQDARRLGLMIRRVDARRWTTQAVLGGRFAFLGAELPEGMEAGGAEEVRLFFRCLEETDQDYSILVHCVPLDAGSRILERLLPLHHGDGFQADHPPVEGEMPTSRWKKGQIFIDRFELVVPPTLQGRVSVRIGFYRPDRRQRLTVREATRPHGRGWIEAGTIDILPTPGGA